MVGSVDVLAFFFKLLSRPKTTQNSHGTATTSSDYWSWAAMHSPFETASFAIRKSLCVTI
ncbi:uncharacterized protein PHALS_00825 [Plasmopara halstedii]|uniref:Uncharacterized protein n=1 Tax=Plasmopara halstedii TaxID=4781 RepID=A0A0P1AU15_PLAHL|nr:uncharacterized protein PHALS_00825 [Plasmopara halstedii]CEG44461.1 hypothetical protein PHALS_00825 [Plasmopara halstedii]|eukprot:XP_024580830.1 hypothetical protein PHALS_00825 [Plasmopara halstedii]